MKICLNNLERKAKMKTENRAVKCDNCEWIGDESDLEIRMSNISHLVNRINPGEIVPAGECNECGALCYLIEKE